MSPAARPEVGGSRRACVTGFEHGWFPRATSRTDLLSGPGKPETFCASQHQFAVPWQWVASLRLALALQLS